MEFSFINVPPGLFNVNDRFPFSFNAEGKEINVDLIVTSISGDQVFVSSSD